MSVFKLNSFNVEIPNLISDKILLLVEQLTNRNKFYTMTSFDNGNFKKYKLELNKYGFRLHKQLRALIQGICIYNTKSIKSDKKFIVSEEDFKDLVFMIKFMNFDFEEI